MFYLFLFMFLLSSKLPSISGCTKVLPSSPAFLPSARSALDTEGVWLPRRLQAPIFVNQRTGTGQNGTPASSLQEAHGGETADTQAALLLVQTQDQSSQITQGLGSLVCKSIPSLGTPRQWCLYLSLLFFPTYKYVFLTKYLWQTQIGQVYSRSNLDKI